MKRRYGSNAVHTELSSLHIATNTKIMTGLDHCLKVGSNNWFSSSSQIVDLDSNAAIDVATYIKPNLVPQRPKETSFVQVGKYAFLKPSITDY